MKKLFCLALIICMGCCLFTGCGEKAGMPYSEDRPVTAEDMAIYNEAMEDNADDVVYEPTLVSTQEIMGASEWNAKEVIGTIYRFTATATPADPATEPYQVYISFYISRTNAGGMITNENNYQVHIDKLQ